MFNHPFYFEFNSREKSYRLLLIFIIGILLSCNLPQGTVAYLDIITSQEVKITSPGDKSKFEEGTTIQFSSRVVEPGDKIVQWSSSKDGILGTDEHLNVSNLSVGTHNISVSLVDPKTNTQESTWSEDFIQIEIYEPAEQMEIESCFISAKLYSWSYEDIKSQIGTGGAAKGLPSCSAKFELKNNSNERIHLFYYSARDNNAMKYEGWKFHMLDPNESFEFGVSHSEYVDGVITYSEVRSIIVFKLDPNCTKYKSEENEQLWYAVAKPIDKLPCP